LPALDLSDIDSGGDDGAEDALRLNLSERSSSMPTPSTGKSITEMWLNILLFLVQTNEKCVKHCYLLHLFLALLRLDQPFEKD
jgi:hypothetical protein